MKHLGNRVEDIKLAYVGGGSRGWAWGLMSDLAAAQDISGTVALYDIDKQAALDNVVIGNRFNNVPGGRSRWDYYACDTLEQALQDADFVVISILPGTFREMASDVHTPESYGIYQSVGDTSGPGGIIRALRTMPMMQHIARAVEKCCPDAWVINYTNPMTLSVKALYQAFPGIKAFGCCHEVFGTQKMLLAAMEELWGITDVRREDIKVNVVGVNHFTWLTKAQYKDRDLYPLFAEMADRFYEEGYARGADMNWANNTYQCCHKVKFDLFRRYGLIAAAGDRHLAEFCPGKWYLESPEQVSGWGFGLTTVDSRIEDLQKRLEKSAKRVSGEEAVELTNTGEDGVNQIRALLGLQDLVTNVNLPNAGQIPNLPRGAVVETNAVFRDNAVTPCLAGEIPAKIFPLISRIVAEQEVVAEACFKRDLELAFTAFASDPLVNINTQDSRALFDQMVKNTAAYLSEYLR